MTARQRNAFPTSFVITTSPAVIISQLKVLYSVDELKNYWGGPWTVWCGVRGGRRPGRMESVSEKCNLASNPLHVYFNVFRSCYVNLENWAQIEVGLKVQRRSSVYHSVIRALARCPEVTYASFSFITFIGT